MIAFGGNGGRHTERLLLDLMGFKSRWKLLRLGDLNIKLADPTSLFFFFLGVGAPFRSCICNSFWSWIPVLTNLYYYRIEQPT
jgi:hypothetical protein